MDTTPPVITIEGETSLTHEAATPYTDSGAVAVDRLDGNVAVVVTGEVEAMPASVPASFTLTYTATDAAGNTQTATRVVTVVDTTPPVMVLTQAAFSLEAGMVPYRLPPGLGSASDTFNGDLTSRITSDIESLPQQPTVTVASAPTFDVHVSVEDNSGNRAVKVVRVTLVDTLPPSLLALNIVWEGGQAWVDPGVWKADDLVDGDLRSRARPSVVDVNEEPLPAPPACEHSSAAEFRPAPQAYAPPADAHAADAGINVFLPAGSFVTQSYSVTDDAGNEAKAQRQVTIVDTRAPEMELLPADASRVVLEFGGRAYVESGVRALDALNGDISSWVCVAVEEYPPTAAVLAVSEDAQGQVISGFDRSSFAVGDRTALATANLSSVAASAPVGTLFHISYTVADAVGHRTDAERSVLVVDTTPPTLTARGGAMSVPFGTVYREAGAEAWDMSDGDLTAHVVTTGSANVDVWWPRDYNVTYSVRDRYSNVAQATRVVTVEPFQLPSPRQRVRLQLASAPRLEEAASMERALAGALNGSFVFVVTWRASDDKRGELNLLPNMTAAARGNYGRRLLATEGSVMEFAARSADTLQWMSANAILERLGVSRGSTDAIGTLLNVTVTSAAPAASGVSSSATNNGATIGAVVAIVLVGIVLVAFFVYRKRRQREVGVKVYGASVRRQHGDIQSTEMYTNPMYEDWHNKKASEGGNDVAPQGSAAAGAAPSAGHAAAASSAALQTHAPDQIDYGAPVLPAKGAGRAGVVDAAGAYDVPKAKGLSAEDYFDVEPAALDEDEAAGQEAYMDIEARDAGPTTPGSYDALQSDSSRRQGPVARPGYDVLSSSPTAQPYTPLQTSSRPPAQRQGYNVLHERTAQLPQAYGVASALHSGDESSDLYALPWEYGERLPASGPLPATYGTALPIDTQGSYDVPRATTAWVEDPPAAAQAGYTTLATGAAATASGYDQLGTREAETTTAYGTPLPADAQGSAGQGGYTTLATGPVAATAGYNQLKTRAVAEERRYGHATAVAVGGDSVVYSSPSAADASAGSLKKAAAAHEAFHGAMSRGTAEALVRNLPEGSFLLRLSTSTEGVVVTLVVHGGRCEHHILSVADGSWHVNGTPLAGCTSFEDAMARLAQGCEHVRGTATLPVARSAEDDSVGVSTDGTYGGAGAIHVGGASEPGPAPAFLHGFISRSEAEQRLLDAQADDGAFLVRTRETAVGKSYALAMLHQGRVSHHLLEQSAPGRPFRVNAKRAVGCLTLEAVVSFLKTERGPDVPGLLSQEVTCKENEAAQA